MLATTTTGIPFGVVNIITEDEQHHIAAVGIDPGVCSREVSMCSRVFLSGETTIVPDASQDPMFKDHPFVTGRLAAIRFYASVPLTTADGFVLGSLCIFSPAPADLSAEKKTALEIIASQVVSVLELQHHARMLARSLEEARNSNGLLESFAGRISHDLRNPLTSIIGFTELGRTAAPRGRGRTAHHWQDVTPDAGHGGGYPVLFPHRRHGPALARVAQGSGRRHSRGLDVEPQRSRGGSRGFGLRPACRRRTAAHTPAEPHPQRCNLPPPGRPAENPGLGRQLFPTASKFR